jgi:hypothetical protein
MPKQDLQCPFCPKTSTRGTGLASHIRGSHPRQYSKWKKDRKVLQNNGSGNSPSKGAEMAGGLNDIIARLEEQKSAIGRALSALRQIEGPGVQSREEKSPAPRKVRTKLKHRITPEGRKRLAEAMKRRWAVKRTAVQARKRGRKAA